VSEPDVISLCTVEWTAHVAVAFTVTPDIEVVATSHFCPDWLVFIAGIVNISQLYTTVDSGIFKPICETLLIRTAVMVEPLCVIKNLIGLVTKSFNPVGVDVTIGSWVVLGIIHCECVVAVWVVATPTSVAVPILPNTRVDGEPMVRVVVAAPAVPVPALSTAQPASGDE
jgi:hypothetical protein